MAISLASLRKGGDTKPPRILIHGPQGLGKSSFAADADSPVFILTEDGLGTLTPHAFPLAETYSDVMEALTSLATEAHDYHTVVIDSLDWLEPLIMAEVCKQHGVKNHEDIPYGKAHIYAQDLWRDYLSALNYLRDEKHMTIIQIAHSEIKRFQNPLTDPYDRYEIKLHKTASAKLQEHSDIVAFVNYRIGITKTDAGFNKKITRAVGSGDRFLFTEERPAYLAKNRYSLPPEIPFTRDGATWGVIAEHVPYFKQES
jgi:hypothetical protein